MICRGLDQRRADATSLLLKISNGKSNTNRAWKSQVRRRVIQVLTSGFPSRGVSRVVWLPPPMAPTPPPWPAGLCWWVCSASPPKSITHRHNGSVQQHWGVVLRTHAMRSPERADGQQPRPHRTIAHFHRLWRAARETEGHAHQIHDIVSRVDARGRDHQRPFLRRNNRVVKGVGCPAATLQLYTWPQLQENHCKPISLDSFSWTVKILACLVHFSMKLTLIWNLRWTVGTIRGQCALWGLSSLIVFYLAMKEHIVHIVTSGCKGLKSSESAKPDSED